MPFMEWNERLVLGIEEIDNDHQKLVALTDELYDEIQAGQGREVLVNTLERLVEYTRAHFAREEKLFQEGDSRLSEEHKKGHGAMVAVVERAQADYVSSGAVAPSLEMMVVLKDWLFDHMLGSDQQDLPFLVKKGS
jgi:hemerythrin